MRQRYQLLALTGSERFFTYGGLFTKNYLDQLFPNHSHPIDPSRNIAIQDPQRLIAGH